MTRSVVLSGLLICLSPLACGSPTEPSIQLLANIVDPNDVNAVSAFNSCQGHPFPQPDARNSEKLFLAELDELQFDDAAEEIRGVRWDRRSIDAR